MEKIYIFALLSCLLLGTAFGGLASDYQFELQVERELCSKVSCNAGQKCVTSYDNNQLKATCKCKPVCPDHQKPVCGSDGITYPNHCELHRTACIRGKKIKIDKKGSCQQEVTPTHPHGRVHKSKPVVCYEHNRDELRDRLIAWMKDMGELLDIDLPRNKDMFKKFFEGVDADKNGKLNRKEFMRLIKSNESVAKIPGEDEYINPILQGLCSDALMALSDEDSDWELSLPEFKRCLDSEFKPPHKLCELEGNTYDDGAEIPTDCNSCVCACGNWVCTALNCDDTDEKAKNKVENQFVLDGKAAKKKLKKEVARHEVRVVGGSDDEESVLMLLKPKKRSKSKN